MGSRRTGDEFGAQETVLMFDAGISPFMASNLESRLHTLVSAAASALFQGHDALGKWAHCSKVDRLGWTGTRLLQDQMSLPWPSTDSRQPGQRALSFVSGHLQ